MPGERRERREVNEVARVAGSAGRTANGNANKNPVAAIRSRVCCRLYCYFMIKLYLIKIRLNQFQEYNLCAVASARSQLQNSGVSAVSVSILRCDLIEELCYYALVVDVSQRLSSCVQVAALC